MISKPLMARLSRSFVLALVLGLFCISFSSIEMFPEKRKDGSWIKKIVFNFPVPVDGEEVKELPLETETTVECVVSMSREMP